ncbi:flagellar hook-length control protein FliK [Cucumibacter marinus]|uniref:flagellar hook-length control protein FliK n=1 Tax=Cucumibacter marinus TaxID=1121252 RepID=UPI0003FD96CD|nr:flagellar hook-length control protein FliK [Cucumibacter marinus]
MIDFSALLQSPQLQAVGKSAGDALGGKGLGNKNAMAGFAAVLEGLMGRPEGNPSRTSEGHFNLGIGGRSAGAQQRNGLLSGIAINGEAIPLEDLNLLTPEQIAELIARQQAEGTQETSGDDGETGPAAILTELTDAISDLLAYIKQASGEENAEPGADGEGGQTPAFDLDTALTLVSRLDKALAAVRTQPGLAGTLKAINGFNGLVNVAGKAIERAMGEAGLPGLGANADGDGAATDATRLPKAQLMAMRELADAAEALKGFGRTSATGEIDGDARPLEQLGDKLELAAKKLAELARSAGTNADGDLGGDLDNLMEQLKTFRQALRGEGVGQSADARTELTKAADPNASQIGKPDLNANLPAGLTSPDTKAKPNPEGEANRPEIGARPDPAQRSDHARPGVADGKAQGGPPPGTAPSAPGPDGSAQANNGAMSDAMAQPGSGAVPDASQMGLKFEGALAARAGAGTPVHQALSQFSVPSIAVEIARQVTNGMNRFQIRLDPPEMGRIDVRLDMDGDKVTARLTVDKRETLDLLMRDQRALERALADAGLNGKQASLEFSLRQDQDGAGNGAGNGSDQGRSDPVFGGSSDEREPNAPAAATAIYRGTVRPGGLDISV